MYWPLWATVWGINFACQMLVATETDTKHVRTLVACLPQLVGVPRQRMKLMTIPKCCVYKRPYMSLLCAHCTCQDLWWRDMRLKPPQLRQYFSRPQSLPELRSDIAQRPNSKAILKKLDSDEGSSPSWKAWCMSLLFLDCFFYLYFLGVSEAIRKTLSQLQV